MSSTGNEKSRRHTRLPLTPPQTARVQLLGSGLPRLLTPFDGHLGRGVPSGGDPRTGVRSGASRLKGVLPWNRTATGWAGWDRSPGLPGTATPTRRRYNRGSVLGLRWDPQRVWYLGGTRLPTTDCPVPKNNRNVWTKTKLPLPWVFPVRGLCERKRKGPPE